MQTGCPVNWVNYSTFSPPMQYPFRSFCFIDYIFSILPLRFVHHAPPVRGGKAGIFTEYPLNRVYYAFLCANIRLCESICIPGVRRALRRRRGAIWCFSRRKLQNLPGAPPPGGARRGARRTGFPGGCRCIRMHFRDLAVYAGGVGRRKTAQGCRTASRGAARQPGGCAGRSGHHLLCRAAMTLAATLAGTVS